VLEYFFLKISFTFCGKINSEIKLAIYIQPMYPVHYSNSTHFKLIISYSQFSHILLLQCYKIKLLFHS